MDTSKENIAPNQGLDFNELKYRRAAALIKLEVSKAQLSNSFERLREHTRSQGLRGLMVNNVLSLKRLRIADYVFLGYKLSNLLYRMWRRRK